MTFATIAGFVFGPIGRWAAIGLAAVALVIMVYRAGISAERARTALDACRLEVSGLRMRGDAEDVATAEPDPVRRLREQFGRD